MDLRDASLGFYRVWFASVGHELLPRLAKRALAPEETGFDAEAAARYLRGAEALGLVERTRAGKYRLRAEHKARLGDPAHPDTLLHHFRYLAQKSLGFGALDGLLHGERPSADLARTYAIATAWDHLAFFERALPREKEVLRRLRDGARVLDLGAGMGNWARECQRRFPTARVEATDLDLTALRETGDVAVVAPEAVEGDAYDVVFLGEVLAAAPEPAAPLEAARRALKPGGILLATEGLRAPGGRPARGWGEKLVAAMDFDFGLDGSRFLTAEEAQSALRGAGFVRVGARDMGGSLFLLRGRRPIRPARA